MIEKVSLAAAGGIAQPEEFSRGAMVPLGQQRQRMQGGARWNEGGRSPRVARRYIQYNAIDARR